VAEPTRAFVPPAYILHHSPVEIRRGLLRQMLSAHGDEDGETTTTDASSTPSPSPLHKIPFHLIPTLDLVPLMTHVASYACTKRGKEAILDLVSTPSPSMSIFDKSKGGLKPSLFGNSQRQRRQDWYDKSRQSWKDDSDASRPYVAPISIAQSAEEAISEYGLVHEAMGILQSQQSLHSTIPLPPMFELYEGVSTSVDSDDDEWIDMCIGPLPPGIDLYQEIDLQTILQAEQVVKLLLETYEWAMSDRINESAPQLVDIVRQMEYHVDEDDGIDKENGNISKTASKGNTERLSELYQTLDGCIEIVRSGPNLSDPHNRFSYEFQLVSNGRFPELDVLRGREEQILKQKKDNSRQLAIIREEMSILENEITRTLIASMIRAAKDVQLGMNTLARLDAIFARASFGCDWDGVIPEIGKEGRLHVEQFVHPVLALEKEDNIENTMAPVPVDLILPGKGGYQALIISGPNGGGKTLALKSFGLVAMMMKLGLPITISRSLQVNSPPVVDFFEDVLVEVGDSQSITKQESTLMARLNALASLIQKMSTSDNDESKLVLLDELGGGTDPVAGSAIAQSILEKLISSNAACKLVATTHSPQLKALSISSDRFECASVLMSNEKHPIFQLKYGTTGESFALEAARRARPSLPDDVIRRAAELMNGGDDDAADSLRRYLSALEQEQINARELTQETEATWNEVNDYKDDMLSKIQVSMMQLSRLESRFESMFDTLKKEETKGTFELVGDSLEELRLLKRKVQTEEELLSEKGLRRVADSHSFYEGETLVIIAEGEWKGYDAIVKAVDADDPLTVTVVPVLDLFSINGDDTQPLLLKRRDVAIFDYPDWGFSDDTTYAGSDSYSTRQQSSSNVLSVLSTLNTSSSKASIPKTKPKEENASKSHTSARQRKASAAAAKGAAKQKKSNKGKKRK